MSITEDSRSATPRAMPTRPSSAGPDSLSGQLPRDTHQPPAVEGQDSPQAKTRPTPIPDSPAGSETSRSHGGCDNQTSIAAADAPGLADAMNDFPGGQALRDTHPESATGDQVPVPTIGDPAAKGETSARDQVPPAANAQPSPILSALLADPLLALAADVLDDLEKVRIANENRLRQLTRSEEDSDGETRGFGLDEAHPDVARLAALVGMLADAEHKATLNLQRVVRKHPLGPWMAAQKGIGEKQGARLLAAVGDPYIRPEITREDGTVEPSRPRMVSELWAYAGYHVVPAGQSPCGTQTSIASGERAGGSPGQSGAGHQEHHAGVAPKKQRGQRANWSAAAKMRAYLIAESCMKNRESPYRSVYDATKQKYAEAVHAAECVRCGPKGKPAPVGSPLSDGHKHARALRAVAKEILKELWREARRIHLETSAGGQMSREAQPSPVASGNEFPSPITEAPPIDMPAAGLA